MANSGRISQVTRITHIFIFVPENLLPFILFFFVFFFVIESKDRSLEEIDTMYLAGVNPITSAKWKVEDLGPSGMQNIATNNIPLAAGGGDLKKGEAAGAGLLVQDENMRHNTPPEA